MNKAEKNDKLRQKLTLLVGAKGEGDSEFTFQDFYDIEALIKSQSDSERKIEKILKYCGQQIQENDEESKVWGMSDEEISSISGKMDILYCISLILEESN